MRDQELLEEIKRELLRCCGPIFIAPSSSSSPSNDTIRSGTYSLIDTGQKRLLVTCYHIWEAYENEHTANPETILAIGLDENSPCVEFRYPLRHSLDFSRDLDLVVFEFDPTIAETKSCFKILGSEFQKADKGESIATIGFPGKWRTTLGMQFNFRGVFMPLVVTDTNDRTIAAFSVEENQSVLSDMKDSLAGISGSPAYRLSIDGELQLIGFAKAGPLESDSPDRTYQSAPGSALPGLFFTHASFLQRNGKLNSPTTR